MDREIVAHNMIRIDNPWVCASSLVGWAIIGWFLVFLIGCGDGGGGVTQPLPPQPRTPPSAQPDMLTATPQGLLRGKASGQGQHLIFAHRNLHSANPLLADNQVYYQRAAPPIILYYPNEDIWSVRTDGTDDRAVLNTTANEVVRDAQGTVAIVEQGTYTPTSVRTDYMSLRDGIPTLLPIHERFTGYRFMRGDTAYFNNEHQIFSTHVNGSGLRTLASAPIPSTLAANDAFDNTLVYREYHLNTGRATLHAVPVGGGASPLTDGQAYVAYAGHVGPRVVFHSCGIEDNRDGTFRATECDVQSVNVDGSGLSVLASHPANEAVQGIIGDQVIVRRNLSGNDQLLAVPVNGGEERLLMTMTDSEFVDTIIGDLLIVRRTTATWTLTINGTLNQLDSRHGIDGFVAVGNAICGNSGQSVWCMPIDGSGDAVRITTDGHVVGVL